MTLRTVKRPSSGEISRAIAPPPVTDADPQIDSQASLAEIQTLIAANKLAEAQARLDKVLAANPRDPKGLALRKDILARMEAARRQALKQKESLEASERLAGLEHQAETLFREGKYAQLPTALDEWLIADPQSARALQLREQLKELQAQQQRFESAAKIKNPDEGLKALQQIERINPSDPRLAELRQRLAGEEFKPVARTRSATAARSPAQTPPGTLLDTRGTWPRSGKMLRRLAHGWDDVELQDRSQGPRVHAAA